MEAPTLLVIAGPNGAGKTTCAMTLLPEMLHIKHFVNADLIARGFSPFDPRLVDIQASRFMVEKMRELRNAGESFAIETTLASKSIANFIEESRTRGYEVKLIFITLDRPETAVNRVAQRVAKGGHYISEETIRRRYFRGIANLFDIYMPLVDCWTILDNSQTNQEAQIVAQCAVPSQPIIFNADIYVQLREKIYK